MNDDFNNHKERHGQTALIYLASGLSERFGSDKLLADLNGRPLISYSAQTARDGQFGLSLAIVNESKPRQSILAHYGFDIQINTQPEKGLGRSLSQGVKYALNAGYKRVIVMLADMPLVSLLHISELARQSGNVVLSECQGVKSPPALIARQALEAVANAKGDQGAKSLFTAPVKTVITSLNEAIDIDTAADLARVKNLMRKG